MLLKFVGQNVDNVPADKGTPVSAEKGQAEGTDGDSQNNQINNVQGQNMQEAQEVVQAASQNGKLNIDNGQRGEVPQGVQQDIVKDSEAKNDEQNKVEPQNAVEINQENVVAQNENQEIKNEPLAVPQQPAP